MSGLATPRRVIISWFNLDLSSVFYRDPSAPGFFQGLTEELNGGNGRLQTTFLNPLSTSREP